MGIKYGIDLGTTNSSIAYATDPSHVRIMQFHVGTEAPPYSAHVVSSKVFVREDRQNQIDIQVGYKAQAAFRKFSFTDAQLIERLKLTIEDDPEWHMTVGAHTYAAKDILAEILKVLRKQAENDIRADSLSAEGVVIGVPVDFKDVSKKIYIQALVLAGFFKSEYEAKKKTVFVSEPLAVAVTNGIDLHTDKNVMVFDFGGGTLDVTIVNLKEQVDRVVKLHPHEVKAKNRITCGGELLTKLFFVNSFCSSEKYGIHEIAEAFDVDDTLTAEELWDELQKTSDGQQFAEEVERLKCRLSKQPKATFTFMGDDGVIVDDKDFSREDFEQAIASEMKRISKLLDQCLRDANMKELRIDEVILAGGSSLIPCVQNMLIHRFGLKKVRIRSSTNRDDENEVLTSVVRGLAIHGGVSNVLDDIVDKDYGIIYFNSSTGKEEFDIIIHRNTRVADTGTTPDLGIGPHSQPYRLTRERPERLKVVVGERSQGTLTPIENVEFDVNPLSQRYTIYMSVNAATGMLKVIVYDEDMHQSVHTFSTSIKKGRD